MFAKNRSILFISITTFLSKTSSFAPSYTSFGRTRKSHDAVSRKDSYDITLLPGDGIGPEIIAVTKDVLNALSKRCNLELNTQEALIGGSAIDVHNDPFPQQTLDQCRNSDSILLACIGGYKWDNNPRELRPETGLLKMRKELNLFANLRPAKVLDQLIESSTLKREYIEGERVGYNNMIYQQHEIERIAHVAGDVAAKRGGKLCSVDKANVLDVSQLWREIVTDVISSNFPQVELSHMYVDNAAMQLIRWPKQFDTIVCGNIFGDILSDEASMLVGSLGMLPSASLGNSGPGVFEPCHGSAPDIAGEDKANPLAMILSAAMMLRYDLERPTEAFLLEDAVESVLSQGLRTADIKQDGDHCRLVGCEEMGKAVAEAVLTIEIRDSVTA